MPCKSAAIPVAVSRLALLILELHPLPFGGKDLTKDKPEDLPIVITKALCHGIYGQKRESDLC